MSVRGRIWLGWTCASAAILLCAAAALGAPPRLDDGFGVDGIASTSFPPQAHLEPFREVASTPDGGVITRSGYGSSTELRHYGPDGSLVKAEPELTNGAQIELQPPEAATSEGGRLVGVSVGGAAADAVSRLGADGTPDPSFGNGGTSERLPLAVQAVAPLPTGKALVAGKCILKPIGIKTEATYQVCVARLMVDGKLDKGFGKGGIVKLRSEDKVAGVEALHVQGRKGGGALVVVASTVIGLDPAGDLDPGFGRGGRVSTPGRTVGATAAGAEGLLVAGTRSSRPRAKGKVEKGEEFYAARYTAAGTLDTTYAGGSGIAVLDPGGEVSADAVLFGADGSATLGGVVAGGRASCVPGYHCDSTPAVVRFGPEGRPDGGFGAGGIVRLSDLAVPLATEFVLGVRAIAARGDGGVFVAGEGLGTTFVAAPGQDGSLDGSFGNAGLVTKGGTEPSSARAIATAVDGAGNVYALVRLASGTALGDAAQVLRYSPDGMLDPGFGEGGKAYVPPSSEGLAVAPDGTAYVLSRDRSTLVALTPSGSLDTGFGNRGRAVLPHAPTFELETVDRMPDGRLLIAGAVYPRGGPWPAAVRLLPDGRPDRSFGKGGISQARPQRGEGWENTTAAGVDPRGRVLIAGTELHGCCVERAVLLRFDRDGRLDRSFGHRGTSRLRRGLPTIDTLATRGRRILAAATGTGRHSTRDLLYSLTADGRLDRHFGEGGVAVARPRNRSREIAGSLEVFSTRDRIILARSYTADPLVAFTPAGKLERGFARRLKGLVPRQPGRSPRVGPAASLAGGDLYLAWSANRAPGSPGVTEAAVNLRRVLVGSHAPGRVR